MKMPAWENQSGTSMSAARQTPQQMSMPPALRAYPVNPSVAETRNVSLIGQAGQAEINRYEAIGTAGRAGIKMGADIYRIESDLDAERAFIEYGKRATEMRTGIETEPNMVEEVGPDGKKTVKYTWEDADERYTNNANELASDLEDEGLLRTSRAKRLFSLRKTDFDRRNLYAIDKYKFDKWVEREYGNTMIALQGADDEESVTRIISKAYAGKILTGPQAASLKIDHTSRVYEDAFRKRLSAIEHTLLTSNDPIDGDMLFAGLRTEALDENLPLKPGVRTRLTGEINSLQRFYETELRKRRQDAAYIADFETLTLADRGSAEGEQAYQEARSRFLSPGAADRYGRTNWNSGVAFLRTQKTAGVDDANTVIMLDDAINSWWGNIPGNVGAFDQDGNTVGDIPYEQMTRKYWLDTLSYYARRGLLSASTHSRLSAKVTVQHMAKQREDVKATEKIIENVYHPSIARSISTEQNYARQRQRLYLKMMGELERDPNSNVSQVILDSIRGEITVEPDWMISKPGVDTSKATSPEDVNVDQTMKRLQLEYEGERREIQAQIDAGGGAKGIPSLTSELSILEMKYNERKAQLEQIKRFQQGSGSY